MYTRQLEMQTHPLGMQIHPLEMQTYPLAMQAHLFGIANMPAGFGHRVETDPSALSLAVGISITEGVRGGREEAAAARSVGPERRVVRVKHADTMGKAVIHRIIYELEMQTSVSEVRCVVVRCKGYWNACRKKPSSRRVQPLAVNSSQLNVITFYCIIN